MPGLRGVWRTTERLAPGNDSSRAAQGSQAHASTSGQVAPDRAVQRLAMGEEQQVTSGSRLWACFSMEALATIDPLTGHGPNLVRALQYATADALARLLSNDLRQDLRPNERRITQALG